MPVRCTYTEMPFQEQLFHLFFSPSQELLILNISGGKKENDKEEGSVVYKINREM
jgi:hypothetical protein